MSTIEELHHPMDPKNNDAEHEVMVDFGRDVGLGKLMMDTLPGENEPDAQCWFKIIANTGPLAGRIVMCQRWQFEVELQIIGIPAGAGEMQIDAAPKR